VLNTPVKVTGRRRVANQSILKKSEELAARARDATEGFS